MTDDQSRAVVPQGSPTLTAISRLAERTLAERASRAGSSVMPEGTLQAEPIVDPDHPARAAGHAVTHVSLGVEALDGTVSWLIPRHTSIPATKSQVFSTASDNQPRLELRLVQGEVPLAADNDFVGRLIVDAIPLAPRGTPRLEITFIVDEDGAIDVKARDCATDRELVAWVDASGDGQ
jgi:molecular chaperone DnaK (HSP70)